MPERDKDEEKTSKSWTYDGSEMEWDTFDRRILRYMRKHYGRLGEDMWTGSMMKFAEITGDVYSFYCEDVWTAIDINDSTKARHLWNGQSGFWKKSWQH